MKVVKYIKENGIKRVFSVIWNYKLELLLEKIMYFFTKHTKLKNIIVIESHNDFDSNGGAFYNYLIANNYNKKYKIIWQVRNRVNSKLPNNVDYVKLYGFSLKKAYYMCISKYFLYDCDIRDKIRSDQILIYCSHGAIGLKNTHGLVNIPKSVDYVLACSKKFADRQFYVWTLEWPNKKAVYLGYPYQDILYNNEGLDELKKITEKKYTKTILWMPTFRKANSFKRIDSNHSYELGVPIFKSYNEYIELNKYLKKLDSLLIIKIHPRQELKDLKIKSLSNIQVLTGEDFKKMNINNYKLMKCTDALISDYSSVSFDYLHLDKPIGYVLDDMTDYKIGFVVENIHDVIAGEEIYNLSDLKKYISNVYNNIDIYQKKRHEVLDLIFEHHDGNSCERLAKFLKL